MTTDRTPSALGLRIARDLLSGYAKHGLATEDMILDYATLIDLHIENDRLQRKLDMIESNAAKVTQ